MVANYSGHSVALVPALTKDCAADTEAASDPVSPVPVGVMGARALPVVGRLGGGYGAGPGEFNWVPSMTVVAASREQGAVLLVLDRNNSRFQAFLLT